MKISILKALGSLLLAAIFVGCGYYRDTDELTYHDSDNHRWTECSFRNDSIISQRSDLSYDNGTVVAQMDSGTGTYARNNLSCGNLGMQSPSTGISIDVYLNDNMESVGIQLFSPNPFAITRFYWVYINRSGCLCIHKADNTLSQDKEKVLKYIQKKDTGIDISGYNNLTLCQNGTGDLLIYLNGRVMHTIKAEDLMFREGNFFIVYQAIPDQNYTSANKGIAKYKLRWAQTLLK